MEYLPRRIRVDIGRYLYNVLVARHVAARSKTIREQVLGPLNLNDNRLTVRDVLSKIYNWNLKNFSFELPVNIINLMHCTYISHNSYSKEITHLEASPTGKLTTKSVYHLLNNNSSNSNALDHDYKWIWSLQCPNKIKLFLWLRQHNRLPIRNYLNSIGIEINSSCHIRNIPETIKHIFLECKNVRKL